MNLLTIEKMSKSYTERMLFNRVTLGINEGDKIGVIGVNGTGKSTLLKIMAGLVEPDEGTITKGNTVSLTYLSQNPTFDDKMTLLENVTAGIKKQTKNWNVVGEACHMLNKLGLEDMSVNPAILSGGQRKRAALVRALLNPADILILDEPTNHLDNEMAQWLETYLKKYQGAFIMVTHDRYFLDEVTNKIVEIDKGNLFLYQANYSKFLTLKLEREEMERASERKKLALYRKDLEWMMRGTRARSTKQKAHIQRFEQLRDRKKPEEERELELRSMTSRLGKKTIICEHITKRYGERTIIKDFSYIFLKNDRIGIVGQNGCGKSTLLKIITGWIKPEEGHLELGDTVEIGYFSQENEALDDSVRVIDFIRQTADSIETNEGSISASQMLERFLFSDSMKYSQIGKLSGGEKRRLFLLKVLMGAPNVLFLDEPTNDLDIQTLAVLEDYLDHFNGIILTVSHDRYFLDRVVNRILAFEGDGKIRQYEGGFTDYKESLNEDAPEKKESEKKEYLKKREKKLKFTYMEQKEYEEIDQMIANLESEIEKLDSQIEREASNYSKLNELVKEKEIKESLLEEKMDRWVYLNDLAERIEQERKELQ